MGLMAEAIRSAFLPCSFALLIPALVLIGISRAQERTPTLGVFAAAAALFAWLPFLDLPVLVDTNLGGAMALAAGMFVITTHRGLGPTLLGGMLVGAFAGSTWIPCVGSEFGTILNRGVECPITALAPMTLYVIGVLVPAIVVLALIEFIPGVGTLAEAPAVLWSAIAVGVLLAGIVLFGRYTSLLSELARRSTL